MRGRVTLLLAVTACLGGLVVSASTAGANANIVGFGATTCTPGWSGKLMFLPNLHSGAAGNAPVETIALKATALPCVGGAPLPASGSVVGKWIIHHVGANNCAVFANPPANVVVPLFLGSFEHIFWTPPAIALTTVLFPSMTVHTTAANQPVQFRTGPTPVLAGTSYPGAPVTQTLFTVKTLAAILGNGVGDCANGSGVPFLFIRAAGTTGTF